MLERRSRSAFAVKVAAGQRDDNALALNQALRPVGGVVERLAGYGDAVDPGLELAGTEKLYIGAPITTMSAARNSSSTLESAKASKVRCGKGLATRSRVTSCSPQLEPFNWLTISR